MGTSNTLGIGYLIVEFKHLIHEFTVLLHHLLVPDAFSTGFILCLARTHFAIMMGNTVSFTCPLIPSKVFLNIFFRAHTVENSLSQFY